MTSNQAKSKADDLWSRAHDMFMRGQPAALELARIEREVEAQIKNTPGEGNAYGAMFFIKVMKRDVEGVIATYNKLRALVIFQPAFYSNAVSAFLNIGQPDRAWSLMLEGVQRYPNSHEVLNIAVRIAEMSGRVAAAVQFENQMRKALSDYKPDPDLPLMETIASFYKRHGITDDQGSLLLTPMLQILARYTYNVVVVPMTLVRYEGGTEAERLTVRFKVDMSISDSIDAMEEYSLRVAESGVPAELADRLTADIICGPAEARAAA